MICTWNSFLPGAIPDVLRFVYKHNRSIGFFGANVYMGKIDFFRSII